MAPTVKQILREIEQAKRNLEKELLPLQSMLHEVRDVEQVTQDDCIVLLPGVTRITEYRVMVQRKMQRLAKNLEQTKALVAEVETSISTVRHQMSEDLRVLAATQQYESLKQRITQLLAEISEAIQLVSQKVELIERRFKEQVGIAITSPQKGEIVHRGTTCTIEWKCIGPTRDYVKIYLLKRGMLLREIVNTPNTGACEWYVPKEVAPADDYQIAVRQVAHGWYVGSRSSDGPSYYKVVSYPDANVSAVSDTFKIV